MMRFPTFDEACFGESLAQLVDHELGPRCRGVPEKPDHGHCGLLRTRAERPPCSCTGNNGDEAHCFMSSNRFMSSIGGPPPRCVISPPTSPCAQSSAGRLSFADLAAVG